MRANDFWHRPKPKKRTESHLIFYPDGTAAELEIPDDALERQEAGQRLGRQARQRRAIERYAKWQRELAELNRETDYHYTHWALCGLLAEQHEEDKVIGRDQATIFHNTVPP